MTNTFFKASLAVLCVASALVFTSCKGGSAKAAQEPEIELPAGVQKYACKGFDLYWVRDNAESSLNKPTLFAGVTDEIINELGLAEGIPNSMSTFLIQQDGKNLLFDAGMGSPASQLLPNLAAIGVAPENIDYIFITHLHGDHVGGLAKDGNAVFPNAKLYLSQPEYDSAPETAALQPYKDNMVTFAFGEELPLGIKALDAVGHTPGHTCFLKGEVLIAGDLMHGAALQMAYPEFCASYDRNPEQSIETRKKMLSYAKENKLLLCGMHFPDGGAFDFRK